MKISQVLNLDLRNEGAMEELQASLSKLPFPTDTVEQLERAVSKMQVRYPLRLAYIMPIIGDDDEPLITYSFMVKRTDNHAHVKTVYAKTLYEGVAKTALLMYAYIKTTLQKEAKE